MLRREEAGTSSTKEFSDLLGESSREEYDDIRKINKCYLTRRFSACTTGRRVRDYKVLRDRERILYVGICIIRGGDCLIIFLG